MAPSRSTVGKLQRDQAKRAKAKAKLEDRLARRSEQRTEPTEANGPRSAEDQAKLLEEFARLHQDLEEGRIGLEEFEIRQADLRERLVVD
jgi:hypothetical protein